MLFLMWLSIAYLNVSQGEILKQLIIDGELQYLKPLILNP